MISEYVLLMFHEFFIIDRILYLIIIALLSISDNTFSCTNYWKNKIIHHKLHYAGHTKIVKIKSNRSSVSLIHAQTCVQSTSSLSLFRPYYSLFFIIFSRVHFLLFCACACVVCFNNVFNIFWENERQQEQKEQNLLVFTCYVSFHKYERIDLVAPFFQKLSINIIFKTLQF